MFVAAGRAAPAGGQADCQARRVGPAATQTFPRRVTSAALFEQQAAPAAQRRKQHRSISTYASAGPAAGPAGGAVKLGTEDAWAALQSCKVFLSSSGEEVRVTDMWNEEEDRVVFAFGRSMG
ncbi:hypothetical protein ABPG75_003491 [Micractinium tetrahymenae]